MQLGVLFSGSLSFINVSGFVFFITDNWSLSVVFKKSFSRILYLMVEGGFILKLYSEILSNCWKFMTTR